MDRQPGGLWEAWLVFFSLRSGAAIATDRETTQSKREHVLYWATGLGPTYLKGALERALALRPDAQLARRIARAEGDEAYAVREAETYVAAATSALRAAAAARDRVVRGEMRAALGELDPSDHASASADRRATAWAGSCYMRGEVSSWRGSTVGPTFSFGRR